MSVQIYDKLSKSFSNVAKEYDNTRPNYDYELVHNTLEKMDLNHSNITIADIGAGSGLFTSMLLKKYPKSGIFAVEPLKQFCDILQSKFKDNTNVSILNQSATSLPFRDSSIDAIFCATSFHWFATNETLIEFIRVLKNNGILYLIWNPMMFNNSKNSKSDLFLKEFKKSIIDANNKFDDKYENQKITTMSLFKQKNLSKLFIKNGIVGGLCNVSFENYQNTFVQHYNAKLLCQRVLSHSNFAILSKEEKTKVEKQVIDLVNNHFVDVNDRKGIEIPHSTMILTCTCCKNMSKL